MRQEVRNGLYERVAVDVVGAIGDPRNQRLRALKPELYALRAAYRARTVEISYENIDRILAYMLAYFPHYVYMAYLVLRDCVEELPQLASIGAAFFGGGPLPEVIGLLEALRAAGRLPAYLNLVAFDLCEDWLPAVNTSLAIAREFNPDVTVQLACDRMDFRQPLSEAVMTSLRDQNLVVLQNCCNEMVSSPYYQANLAAISASLADGALLVIADQSNYPASVAALAEIESRLRNNPDLAMLRTFSAAAPEVRSPFSATDDIRDNFFDGINRPDAVTGQWPNGQFERSKLKFSYMLARKSTQLA